MKKQTNKTTSGTNAEQVKQQNAAANKQYGTEFASETNAAEVKRQNQQAEANKKNASQQNNQQNR
ncbi:gamma-type small acid-soluble spore protein [Jeotgalibacillus campisalis]|uniref:Small, acid-soluble spore protein gamma-type n=1 Tax=Jeotgalibacillus campisalis TaxID=220754 RepID=A0A0C2RZE0_9BACL|nr:gamma-type small acid-soluble spore protein [Jeotgalibacillus campisalis]KIL47169.1 hypothetical protein KR50_24910 [Jeotgalibacillus campisalis]